MQVKGFYIIYVTDKDIRGTYKYIDLKMEWIRIGLLIFINDIHDL